MVKSNKNQPKVETGWQLKEDSPLGPGQQLFGWDHQSILFSARSHLDWLLLSRPIGDIWRPKAVRILGHPFSGATLSQTFIWGWIHDWWLSDGNGVTLNWWPVVGKKMARQVRLLPSSQFTRRGIIWFSSASRSQCHEVLGVGLHVLISASSM